MTVTKKKKFNNIDSKIDNHTQKTFSLQVFAIFSFSLKDCILN
jgi:hypothetical protein